MNQNFPGKVLTVFARSKKHVALCFPEGRLDVFSKFWMLSVKCKLQLVSLGAVLAGINHLILEGAPFQSHYIHNITFFG